METQSDYKMEKYSEVELTENEDENETEDEFIGIKEGYIHTNEIIEMHTMALTLYEIYFIFLLYFMLYAK